MIRLVATFTLLMVLFSVWVFYTLCVALYAMIMFGWGKDTRDYVSERVWAFWRLVQRWSRHG